MRSTLRLKEWSEEDLGPDPVTGTPRPTPQRLTLPLLGLGLNLRPYQPPW